jgi:toxin ParE1/3/4
VADLRFTAIARVDLASIHEYSADRFGDDVADSYIRDLTSAFGLLREHPSAGAAMPDLGRSIRCLTHRSHRIFYRMDKTLVLVLRIIHHAQDARGALRKTRT